MSEQRIRYGLALGRVNNFTTGIAGQKGYLAGTDGLFAQASTGPDVSTGYLFYTNNSGATIISDFQVAPFGRGTGGNQAPMSEGKVIKIIFLDSNTTVSGSRIYLAGTDNTFNVNAVLDLIYHNSGWYEMSRTNPKEELVSFTLGASQGLNANFTKSILFSGESALVIQGVSGGYVGQSLYLINGGSGQTITVSTAGNIRVSTPFYISNSSKQLTIGSGGAVELYKTSPTIWSTIGYW